MSFALLGRAVMLGRRVGFKFKQSCHNRSIIIICTTTSSSSKQTARICGGHQAHILAGVTMRVRASFTQKYTVLYTGNSSFVCTFRIPHIVYCPIYHTQNHIILGTGNSFLFHCTFPIPYTVYCPIYYTPWADLYCCLYLYILLLVAHDSTHQS